MREPSATRAPDRRPIAGGRVATPATYLGPLLPVEIDADVARYGRHILERQLVAEREATYWLMWVRMFLERTTLASSAEEAVRQFVEGLASEGYAQWRVAQAERSARRFCGPWRGKAADPPAASGAVADDDAVARLRALARLRHYSPRTEETYVDWVLRYVRYVDEVRGGARRTSHEVSGALVRDFLSHLATRRRVAASTQNQAFSALLVLGRDVLSLDLGDLSKTVRARRGPRLPSALSVEEVASLLEGLHGTPALVARLIYGGGLRVLEACQLRVKDFDFDQGLIVVRGGKGDKDRTTLLARAAVPALRAHLETVLALH